MTVRYLDLQALNAQYEPALSRAVTDVVVSGRYLRGEQVAAFESAFAHFCGAAHCIGVGNGLDALTLILLALKEEHGWSEETEVLVPAMTFVATALAVSRAGLRPVFCDVTRDALIDPAAAEQAVTPHTRALIAVHLYGAPCPPLPLQTLCQKHGLAMIEDAAQAHDATSADGQRVGSIGLAAAFSFYPGKNLGALGDGGAVCTNDAVLARRIRALANYGAEVKYEHQWLGLNSRLDEVQAAVLLTKLPRLHEETLRRRAIAARYAREIVTPAVSLPYEGRTNESVFHIYPLLCPQRDALKAHLQERGIETLIHYPLPLHCQPCYGGSSQAHYPTAERIAREELSLPLNSTLSEAQVGAIIEAVNSFSGHAATSTQ